MVIMFAETYEVRESKGLRRYVLMLMTDAFQLLQLRHEQCLVQTSAVVLTDAYPYVVWSVHCVYESC
jgi:hypothetical protein